MIGCDLQCFDKIKSPEKLFEKIGNFKEKEYAFSGNIKQNVGTLWAVKEAVFKALDLKQRLEFFKDIVYLHAENGRPKVELFGKAKERFQSLNMTKIDISVSHSSGFVMAVCEIC